jgi:hypothetical protein
MRSADQALQLGQARRRVQRRGAGFGPPERAEHPAQPGQRLPARVLDGVQRVAGLGRLRVDDPAADPGLDGDDPDAVRDHVVRSRAMRSRSA